MPPAVKAAKVAQSRIVHSYSRGFSWGQAALVLLAGAIVGSALVELLGDAIPVLARSARAGFDVEQVNLAGVVDLAFRFHVKVNLGTALGVLLAAWVLRR